MTIHNNDDLDDLARSIKSRVEELEGLKGGAGSGRYPKGTHANQSQYDELQKRKSVV